MTDAPRWQDVISATEALDNPRASNPDDRRAVCRAIMAIDNGGQGFELFASFCQRADAYIEDEIKALWDSQLEVAPADKNTLFRIAAADGWPGPGNGKKTAPVKQSVGAAPRTEAPAGKRAHRTPEAATAPQSPSQFHEPPKNLNAERTVLGACLIDPAACATVLDTLQAKQFYPTSHQEIFEAIKAVYDAGNVMADVVSVPEHLDRHGKLEVVGGAAYLASFQQHVLTTQNVAHYCRLVNDAWQRRELIQASHEIIEDCHRQEFDNAELVEATEKRIEAVAGQSLSSDYDPWGNARSIADAYKLRPAIRYLVTCPDFGISPLPSVGLLVGTHGTMKTMLALDKAACIVSSQPWLIPKPLTSGRRLDVECVPVLWLNFDNPSNSMDGRIEAIFRGHDVPPDAPFHYYSFPDPHLDATDRRAMDMLANRILRLGALYVIVDCLQTIRGGVEENSSEMGQIITAFRHLSERTGAAIDLIHHTNKENNYRGSSAILDLADFSLKINREEHSEHIIVRPGKMRDAVILPFAAEFSYTRKPNSSELATARFWGIPLDSEAEEIRQAVLDIVEAEGEIGKTKLIKTIIEAVEISAPSATRNQVRKCLAEMTSKKALLAAPGPRNSTIFSLPPEDEG